MMNVKAGIQLTSQEELRSFKIRRSLATSRHTPGFLRLILCGSSVCVSVGVCVHVCVRP